MRARTLAAGLLTAALLPAQNIDANQLLAKIIGGVQANDRSILRYICRQRIVRRSWIPGRSENKSCAGSAAGPGAPRGMKLARLDRVALDVMITRESEMFSWPGAQQFEAKTPGEVVGHTGLSASGDFGSFLAEIFGRSGVNFHYDGSASAGLVRFHYDVPKGVSSFEMRGSRGTGVVAYRGSFDADPRTGDLVRLEIESVGAPPGSGLCGSWEQIQYVHQGPGSTLMIAEQTDTAMFAADGHYSENQTSYEACRQYGVEATLKFDDDAAPAAEPAKVLPPPSPPPPGTEFNIRLTTPVDSESGWAGDRIQGALASPALDPATHHIVAPRGTIVRGRVTLLQHQYEPVKGILVGISFNTIVLNGVDIPLVLVRAEPGASGVWTFNGRKKAVLAEGFESRWRVRTKEDQFLLATPN